MIVNKGRKNEVAVRVVCESESYGREILDYGSLERCMGGLIRIVQDAIECAGEDGVSRVVGIALIPRSDYGDESGYCPDFEDGEHGSNVPFPLSLLRRALLRWKCWPDWIIGDSP